jgi:hypothetical protein
MSQRRLEVKVLPANGSSPEVVEIPLNSPSASKLNLFVFRRPTSMGERDIEELVQISTQVSGHPGAAIILGEEDKFEVYEVEIPTRYERKPVI